MAVPTDAALANKTASTYLTDFDFIRRLRIEADSLSTGSLSKRCGTQARPVRLVLCRERHIDSLEKDSRQGFEVCECCRFRRLQAFTRPRMRAYLRLTSRAFPLVALMAKPVCC